MTDREEIWRWNSEPAWHYHCSMSYEAAMASDSNNDFVRYHHVRTCVYFAVSTIETFLNQQMRRHLEEQEIAEEAILKRLRSHEDKRKDWPSEICGKEVNFSSDVHKVFETYRLMRNEITHPKRRDHSIYLELESANPDELVEAISVAIVTIHEGMGEPFPYWVLGWNYVGMNGNPAYPVQSNNLNGFVYSLIGMGFQGVRSSDLSWERRHMFTVENYKHLKSELAKYPVDIEPYWPDFPMRPRLTRRWWDHEFINKNIREAKEEAKRLEAAN